MCSKLKICFYGDFESLHTRRWADYFIREGYDVHILADKPLDYPGAAVHLCEINTRMPFRWVERFRALRRIVNEEIKPQVFHVHFVTHYGYGGALSGFHPFVLTAWGSDLYTVPKRSRLDYFMTRFSLKKADLITVDSQDLGKRARELGADPSKIHLVQFGVEPERYRNIDATDLRNELGIPSEAFVVLSMRNLKPLYNHDIVIRAAKQIVTTYPNCYFLIVGKGEQKQELVSLVKELDLEGKVRILDEQPHERVPKFLALADIYVSVPSSDATSVTLLEAMASELPVVVSDLPSNKEWIEDKKTGLVVSSRSETELAEAIQQLLSSPKLMETMSKNEREVVQSKASHQTNMRRMEELYWSLPKLYS